jgi:hypothetical protein
MTFDFGSRGGFGWLFWGLAGSAAGINRESSGMPQKIGLDNQVFMFFGDF